MLEIQKILLAKGVPEDATTLDTEGLRTWESVRHAAEIYHYKTVTVITDGFHAPRSIFICRHFGIDAVAFCGSEEGTSFWSVRSQLREYLARVKAVADTLTN